LGCLNPLKIVSSNTHERGSPLTDPRLRKKDTQANGKVCDFHPKGGGISDDGEKKSVCG